MDKDHAILMIKDMGLGYAGGPAEYHGDVNFLDGIAIYRRDGRLFIQSHHGGPVALEPTTLA